MPGRTPSFVYIMTSRSRRVLYVGVTNDLRRRTAEHQHHLGGIFSRRYALDTLVWYEVHYSIESAILREKQLKAGSRLAKIRLVEAMNPDWVDLSSQL